MLFVSPVAKFKGGAGTALLEMLGNPLLQPALALPAEGGVAQYACRHGIPHGFFDLGAAGQIRRPARLRDAARAARNTLRAARRLARLAGRLDADLVHTPTAWRCMSRVASRGCCTAPARSCTCTTSPIHAPRG